MIFSKDGWRRVLQTGMTLSPPQLGSLSIPQRPVPAGLIRGLSDLRGSVRFTGCPSANHPTPHGAQESGPDWDAQPLLTAPGHCGPLLLIIHQAYYNHFGLAETFIWGWQKRSSRTQT